MLEVVAQQADIMDCWFRSIFWEWTSSCCCI